MNHWIKAEGIYKKYDELEVLKGIDLEIEKGEVISIVGSSGAGKTTLLQILGTLDKPDRGKITIANEAIENLNGKALARFRNKHLGFIFQFHQLLPEFTAIENVCIPAFIGGVKREDAIFRANELLDMLGLASRTEHKPHELSGGEQQRVAVARALINQPSVIFADEPSGNLDSHSSEELHNLFFTLRDNFQQTFVIVTHNRVFAEMADRMLTMKDGLICYD
jgi:lipoprotein-releasing system ATP-binding protein